MDPILVGGIGFVIMLLLMFCGVHIAFAMSIVGFLGFAYISGFKSALGLLQQVPFNSAAIYTVAVFPLFMWMGELALHAGLSERLFIAAHNWLGRLPGGLAVATMASCGAFSAICGSSIATASTISAVAVPEMKRLGYDPALSTGSVAAGGTLGILIPPSMALVVYGMITEQSVGRLLVAGILPGILLTLLFMAVIIVMCVRKPELGAPAAPSSITEKLQSLRSVWTTLLLFLVVIGGIYIGVFTPTEAAAIGAFGALFVALSIKKLTWSNFKDSLFVAGRNASMLLIVFIGAMLFSYFMAITRIPMELGAWLGQLSLSRYVILVLIVILHVVLGCVMEAMSVVILTAPILLPAAIALGFDPIWYGVLMVVMVEAGLITPPVGLNVYVIAGMNKDVPIGTVFRGTAPFLGVMLLLVVILTVFPQIALYLPNTMIGK